MNADELDWHVRDKGLQLVKCCHVPSIGSVLRSRQTLLVRASTTCQLVKKQGRRAPPLSRAVVDCRGATATSAEVPCSRVPSSVTPLRLLTLPVLTASFFMRSIAACSQVMCHATNVTAMSDNVSLSLSLCRRIPCSLTTATAVAVAARNNCTVHMPLIPAPYVNTCDSVALSHLWTENTFATSVLKITRRCLPRATASHYAGASRPCDWF